MARFRKAGTRLLVGIDDLDAKLADLQLSAANKIVRPALTKGARYLVKKIKSRVPPKKKDAKRAIGFVVDAKGGKSKNQQRAKVGAGVGKAFKSIPKRSGKNSGGVGISGRNIHWFILGTKERVRDTDGRSTGAMPPVLSGIVKQATAQESSAYQSIVRTEVMARLEKLAAK